MTKRLFLLLTVLSISHTYEQAGLNLTSEMKAFRDNWLGTKVK